MIALINFKNSISWGWFKLLKFYFFPKIKVTEIEKDEFINTQCCKIDIVMPIGHEKCMERALRKLVRTLDSLNCCFYITVKGKWSDYLKAAGFKTGDYGGYLKDITPDAIERLCRTAAITPDMLKICLHDPDFEDKSGIVLNKLVNLCKTIIYLTNEPEKASDLIDKIYEETGSAIIVADDSSKLDGVNLTVSLAETQELTDNKRLPYCTVIFSADKDFLPKAYTPYLIINAFSTDMPQSLVDLMPNGLRPWEFIGILYYLTHNTALLNLKIYMYYSCGKCISEKHIVDSIIGLDKKSTV